MKDHIAEYTRIIEARARFYMRRIKTDEDHEKYYCAALALCRVISDFTGEDRWDVHDRLKQEVVEQAA